MSTRDYHSPRRQAEAAATRARIVEAAGRLFVAHGYVATPIKAIAEAAGVSVPTVHLNGPKHALLIAAFERAFAGDEGSHSLADRAALVDIMAEPDAQVAIERYVAFLAEANGRAAGIVRALTLAADADPGARAAFEELEQRRRRDMAVGAEFFVQRGLLDDDRRQWAADLLGLYTSSDTYLHLVGACGWTRARYEQWLGGALRGMLS